MYFKIVKHCSVALWFWYFQNYKKRKSLSCLKPNLKSTYKKQSVDSAIAEAEKLVKSTYEERIGTCQFKYDPNKQIQQPQIGKA